MPSSTSNSRSRHRVALRVAVSWVLFLAAWEAAYRIVGWKPWLFPAPSHVLDASLAMLHLKTAFGEPLGPSWPFGGGTVPSLQGFMTSPLLQALAVSFVRLLIGFALSLVLGTTLGLLMWRYAEVDSVLGPAFLGLQTLPSVVWVPLAILLFGIQESGIMFVLVMGSFFAIAVALRDGLRQSPPILRQAALMLGARRWNLYRHVVLPAGLPAMAGSLRQGFAFAWRSLMGAELIFTLQRHGVGFLLNVGREFADVAQVVAVMIVMVVIGMTVDRVLFARLELRVRERFGLA
jgi:NitT/TauT family transport system permease protein